MKTLFTSKRSISMLIFLIFGTIYLTLGYKLIKPSLYIIGSLVTLAGIIKLTMLNKANTPIKEYTLDLVEGVFALFIGIISIKFYNYNVAIFIMGVLYLLFPIIRLFMSINKLNQLFVDSLKYMASIVMISCIYKEELTQYIVALIFYGIALFIFITLLFKIRREKRGEAINEENCAKKA